MKTNLYNETKCQQSKTMMKRSMKHRRETKLRIGKHSQLLVSFCCLLIILCEHKPCLAWQSPLYFPLSPTHPQSYRPSSTTNPTNPYVFNHLSGNAKLLGKRYHDHSQHQRSRTRMSMVTLTDITSSLQFEDLGRQLMDNLDIGGALNNDVGRIPEAATSIVLESIGHDILVFLAVSVFVTPISNALGITPILGYLFAGAILGPHGIDIFANSKADVELGDFGILFLLFSEGLEVSSSRFQQLTNYLPLGLAQLSLTAGVLTAAVLAGAPLLGQIIPLDSGLIDVSNPVEALILAFAGTLSTSAFIFPVLKEKGWEEQKR